MNDSLSCNVDIQINNNSKRTGLYLDVNVLIIATEKAFALSFETSVFYLCCNCIAYKNQMNAGKFTLKPGCLQQAILQYYGQMLQYYSQNTKSVPLPLLYSVVIYCTLFCFSEARSDLSANIATIVFEMICFNKISVFR